MLNSMNYSNMFQILPVFFRPLTKLFTSLWPHDNPPLAPPSPITSSHNEHHEEEHTMTSSATTVAVPVANSSPPPPPPQLAPGVQQVEDDHNQIKKWIMVMIGFFIKTATDIAVKSSQFSSINDPIFSKVHLLSYLILFTFTALFVADFIRPKFLIMALVLEGLGLFLGVSAFCCSLTIPLPSSLKITTWATFVICLIVILICRYCF